jgi:hypothetical protein
VELYGTVLDNMELYGTIRPDKVMVSPYFVVLSSLRPSYRSPPSCGKRVFYIPKLSHIVSVSSYSAALCRMSLIILGSIVTP